MTEPVAVVAGDSRGLGLLIARELVTRGYRVSICARDADELERARGWLSAPGRVHTAVCDVTDRSAVARWLDEVGADLGPVDVAITVAGVIQMGPGHDMTLDHFDNAIDVMLRGPIHVARLVEPGMRERGRGRIGTVTSVGGIVSPPHLLPYATAKFGAVGFSDGLAASLAGSGVTATTIVPGLMRTGSQERALRCSPATPPPSTRGSPPPPRSPCCRWTPTGPPAASSTASSTASRWWSSRP